MPSSELIWRSRLWRISRLISPTTCTGERRNRSSDRVTTPSVEFSIPEPRRTARCRRRWRGTLRQSCCNKSGRQLLPKNSMRRLFAEGTLRAQYGHALRRFQCQAGRHDFAPDREATCWFSNGPWLASCIFSHHLGHAVWAKKRRTLFAFEFADFFCHVGALVDQ